MVRVALLLHLSGWFAVRPASADSNSVAEAECYAGDAACLAAAGPEKLVRCGLADEPRRLVAHLSADAYVGCRDVAIRGDGCAERKATRKCACTLARALLAMPRVTDDAATIADAACTEQTAARVKDLGMVLLLLAGHDDPFGAVSEYDQLALAGALCEAALRISAATLDASYCAAHARRLLAGGASDWDTAAAHRRHIVSALRPFPADDEAERHAAHQRERLRTPWLSFSTADSGGGGHYSPLSTANSGKLRHDAEQMRHLIELGILDAGRFEPTAAEFDALADAIESGAVTAAMPRGNVALGGSAVATQAPIPPSYARVRATYGRLLHSDPLFALRGGAEALGAEWKGRPVEDHFADSAQSGGVPVAVIDNFLSEETLKRLLRFCKRSTVWHNPMHGAYLGAYESTGFTGGLIYQIAEELRARVPGILGDYPLGYAWAYLYLDGSKGIRYHADIAAFTANFWITPDDANLDVEGSGMIISEVAAPQDWDATRATSNLLSEQLLWNSSEGGGQVQMHRVPYKQNRCVLFNSSYIHHSDAVHFKPGFHNHRINVGLFFGRRS